MEDEAIITLFFQRDQRAIQELDKKYGKVCHALAHRLTGDRRDGEECVNQAYLGVWNAIPPHRPEALLAYVCKIVRNTALHVLEKARAAKRDGHNLALEELADCLPAGETAESALEAGEVTRAIEDFLDGISQENRAIFLGRYWFAASYREIGERVGMSEKAVSVRLSRLRQKLRDFLKERGVFV